ncbi:MAG: hypothetical protein HY070_05340 [Chloroflexi bacterium]|nr:hypothetical protein [Chloroflexota bacterium]
MNSSDGSQIPRVTQDENARNIAETFAPIILADAREPFTIVAVGYTIFDRAEESPSFVPRRRIDWDAAGYRAARAIEFSLWWDFDIGHLYELEHVWTYINAHNDVVAVEASSHGMYLQMEIDGKPPLEKSHPILFAQPGKHAMAATIAPFMKVRAWAEEEAGIEAGVGGVHDGELFGARLPKTRVNDELARAYLKQRAFIPTWNFTKRIPVAREILLPWRALEEWIPRRVEWWIEKLKKDVREKHESTQKFQERLTK